MSFCAPWHARFWHKVLYDRGYVGTTEPFQKLVNQGMILGETEFTAFKDAAGDYVTVNLVEIDRDGKGFLKSNQMELVSEKLGPKAVVKKGDVFVLAENEAVQVDSRANKMSKSRGNVVNPDDVVEKYGADSLRLYEMFMGPLEAVKPWSMDGVSGVRNFLDRAWRMVVDVSVDGGKESATVSPDQNRILHKTIKAVTEDIRGLSFNTAIARMMEFVNFFLKQESRPKEAMEKFVLLLSPFAPHIAEELWERLGHDQTLAYEPWPTWDEEAIRESTLEIPVSIGGKLKSKITVPADCDAATMEQTALADPKIAELLAGREIVKKIVVPGRMVNFVVK